jgi:putative phosphoesterase
MSNTMRIAFISDIHANFTALGAVLADLDTQNVDQIISLGDTVTLGPQPVEVLNKLRELKGVCIKGNHDAAILNPGDAEKFQITDHLLPDLQWCRDRLSSLDLEFIDSFKDTYEFKFPNGISVLCFHGSPTSSTDIILSTSPAELMDKHFRDLGADVFIGGHSHIQMYRRHGEKLILNSGSVGNAFMHAYQPGNTPTLLPWAEYLILGQKGQDLDVDLRRVNFDTQQLLSMVVESGLPGLEWWSKQYKVPPEAVKSQI